MISGPSTQPPEAGKILEEKIRVAIHPEYPEQTIAIGSTLTEKGRKEPSHSTRTKLRRVCLEASGYDGRSTKHCGTLLEYPGGMPTCQAKEKRGSTVKKQSNPRRSGKTGGCRDHERSALPQLHIKGYHQIKMAKEDEEKTAFTTSQGIFCYSKMPFGLKNVGATYQRLVDKAFQRQIGRNLKQYDRKKPTRSSLAISEMPKDVQKTEWETSKFKQEAEAAFKQMKKLIAELPMLTAPKEKEELIVYLAAAKEAISAVLMTDREDKQVPVYFVSHQPIKQLLSSSEISRRMLKWKFELEGYDIQYRPRTAIKGQILADFIVERPEEESPDEPMTEPEEIPEPWTLFTDGSSCIDGSGAGLILTNPEGVEFTYAMRFTFEATNNEAEYEALIAGLRIAEQMGVKNLQAHVLVEELKEKSINEKEILAVVEEEGNTWMTPICEYLTKEILPADKKKARAIRRKAVRVCGTSFRPGDMVYRSNDASHARDGGKLGPKWEGPYEVAESLGKELQT
ncbi:reverse transcriptase domain-containing protein [Tanacetum coccineum]